MDELATAIMEALSEAFPAEPLGEAAFKDSLGMWGGYLDAGAFESGVLGRTWLELKPRFLEFHHDVMAYAGPETFAAVLPAYLAALVRMDDELDALPQYLLGALTREDRPRRQEIFDARVAHLTDRQRKVIARVLEVLSESPRHEYYAAEIAEALDRYWRALDMEQEPT